MTSKPTCNASSFSRRGLLRGAVLGAGGCALLGAAPAALAQTKFSQSMARYQATPKGSARCDSCAQFQGPGACKVVDGAISPNGWCFLYVAKPKA